jgi:hypothetical protein
MTHGQISGWKNYSLATGLILIGLYAFYRGNSDGGIKAILVGCAIITLRDAIGKGLRMLNDNCEALEDLRAAIETVLSTRRSLR